MKKEYKSLKPLLIAVAMCLPLFASAQYVDTKQVLSNDTISVASVFASSFSILLSILIGFIATGFVFRAASKMGGGLFGVVLYYIGAGMLLVVFGTISAFFAPLIDNNWLTMLHTVSFAIGYVFMVIGSNKLLKGILSN